MRRVMLPKPPDGPVASQVRGYMKGHRDMTGVGSPTAVVVTGQDAVATASAALDLARAEARQRAVTVVDLIGDAAPMHNAVASPDAHGVADCFAYGVSFGAVTRPTSID